MATLLPQLTMIWLTLDDLITRGRKYLAYLHPPQPGPGPGPSSASKKPRIFPPYTLTGLATFQSEYETHIAPTDTLFLCAYGTHGEHRDYVGSCGMPGAPGFRKIKATLRGGQEGSDWVVFENALSRDGRVLDAMVNFRRENDDDISPGVGLHWSEVVTYSVALERRRRRVAEAAGEGNWREQGGDEGEVTQADLAAIGEVRRIVRSNICNEEWCMAKGEVVERWKERSEADGSVTPRVVTGFEDVWIELRPGMEEFDMMMGTVNGLGVVYLLAHNKEAFPPGIGIAKVWVNPHWASMEIVLEVMGA